MTFNKEYAVAYDSIHSSRDYLKETELLIDLLSSLGVNTGSIRALDFGCGTGIQTKLMSERGIDIVGYDPSTDMLAIARQQFKDLVFESDVTAVRTGNNLVYSLFDVLSYQPNADKQKTFITELGSKISSGGYLVLDYWHLSGVQLSNPEFRETAFNHNGKSMIRRVYPSTDNGFKTTSLRIELSDFSSGEILDSSTHVMQAFSRKEVSLLLSTNGFKNVKHLNIDFSSDISETDWRSISFAIKI